MLRIVEIYVEIYKIINKLNSEVMKNDFNIKKNNRLVREKLKLNLGALDWIQVTFGTKSLKANKPVSYKYI